MQINIREIETTLTAQVVQQELPLGLLVLSPVDPEIIENTGSKVIEMIYIKMKPTRF